jgi:hypothetical protein
MSMDELKGHLIKKFAVVALRVWTPLEYRDNNCWSDYQKISSFCWWSGTGQKIFPPEYLGYYEL